MLTFDFSLTCMFGKKWMLTCIFCMLTCNFFPNMHVRKKMHVDMQFLHVIMQFCMVSVVNVRSAHQSAGHRAMSCFKARHSPMCSTLVYVT
jgi:hypothetical protein